MLPYHDGCDSRNYLPIFFLVFILKYKSRGSLRNWTTKASRFTNYQRMWGTPVSSDYDAGWLLTITTFFFLSHSFTGRISPKTFFVLHEWVSWSIFFARGVHTKIFCSHLVHTIQLVRTILKSMVEEKPFCYPSTRSQFGNTVLRLWLSHLHWAFCSEFDTQTCQNKQNVLLV